MRFLHRGAKASFFPLALPSGALLNARAMSDPLPEHKDFIHSEEFLQRLMRRQLKLSVACAAAFMVVLLGLPLLNYFAPDFMATRIGGFTLTWLILGVLMFPFVWIISGIFIKVSLKMEAGEAAKAREENAKRSGGVAG
jgi:uncharacterized membrane protein (DUF485 family)